MLLNVTVGEWLNICQYLMQLLSYESWLLTVSGPLGKPALSQNMSLK